MGWFGWGSSKKLSTQEVEAARKRCKAFITGLEGCRKANAGDELACKHLEMRLVTCLAEEYAKEEADENRRCYTKLYKTGMYKGLGHCGPYEDAMKKTLKAKGLYPV